MPSSRHIHHPAPVRAVGLRLQRGVVGLMGVLTLLLALSFTALSVDTGRLWLERRGVQRAADMAALSASRFIGCGTSNADGLKAAQEVAAMYGIPASAVTLEYGRLTLGADKTQVFTPGGTSETAGAVRVNLSKTVPQTILLRGYTQADTLIPASGTARGNAPVASFSINSVFGPNQSLANAMNSLFGAILGTSSLNLSPASLQALLAETVSLGQLQRAAQLNSVEALLDKGYTLSGMLQLFAAANPDIASNAAFKQIAAAAANRPAIQLSLGQVISVYRPVSAGVEDAQLNMLDLVITGVQVGGFNGGGRYSFSSSGIFTFGISVLNAPKLAVGPAGAARNGQWCTSAQSSQTSIKVGIDLSWLLGLADMLVRVDTSSVEGHLKSLTVAPGNIRGVINSQSSAITLVLTNNDDKDKPILPATNFGPAKVLGGLFGLKIYQQLFAGAPLDKTFSAASRANLPTQVQLGAGSVGQSISGLLGNQSIIEVSVLFGLFKLPIGFLDDLVTFILSPLGNLLDGLLALFGIQTGSVYLQMRTVDTAPPVLVR